MLIISSEQSEPQGFISGVGKLWPTEPLDPAHRAVVLMVSGNGRAPSVLCRSAAWDSSGGDFLYSTLQLSSGEKQQLEPTAHLPLT